MTNQAVQPKDFVLPRTTSTNIVYLLVIEWDGKRPPTRWYNRLASLGLYIRGSKEQSPLARRKAPTGVVHQEGTLFLESLSQAKTLGLLAKSMGAVTVTVGETRVLDTLMTYQDKEALTRIHATLGRRGRPPKNDYHAITCHDCLHTVEVFGQEPPNCQLCGSFRISVRAGKQVRLRETGDSDPIMRQWINTRFVSGSWEEPIITTDEGVELKKIEYGELEFDIQKSIYNVLGIRKGGTTLLSQLAEALKKGTINSAKALRYLDVAYRVVQLDIRERLDKRALAIAEWYRQGNSENEHTSLFVDEENIDAFDLWVFEKEAPFLLM